MSSPISGASGAGKPRFKFDESFKIDVKEPSGLAYIPEMDRFVAVDGGDTRRPRVAQAKR